LHFFAAQWRELSASFVFASLQVDGPLGSVPSHHLLLYLWLRL
jgi:hypothetical protein